MNVNQIKTRIFILKAVDLTLVTTLMIASIYTALYAENKEFMIICCLVGLFLVNTIGRMTSNKIAIMHVQLEMLVRDQKREHQRTLMNTRHTNISRTKTASTKIDHSAKI